MPVLFSCKKASNAVSRIASNSANKYLHIGACLVFPNHPIPNTKRVPVSKTELCLNDVLKTNISTIKELINATERIRCKALFTFISCSNNNLLNLTTPSFPYFLTGNLSTVFSLAASVLRGSDK